MSTNLIDVSKLANVATPDDVVNMFPRFLRLVPNYWKGKT
jgi:hypothetical protein